MKKKLTGKKSLVITAAIIAVAAASFGGYKHFHAQPVEPPGKPTSPINYGPATQEEKDQAQANKERLAEQNQQTESTATTSGKPVTPVITNASQIQQEITINAYVGGIFENGGTCTFTISQGSTKLTKTNEAFANASTTDCPPVRMQRSEFPTGGDWQVILDYSSGTHSGTTQPKTLTLH